VPRSLSEVCKTVDARCILFHSFTVDFDFQILIEPYEPREAVPAENSHDRDMPRALQALLKVFVDAGRMGGFSALARVTVEVRQQPMPELLKPDQQIVRGPGLAGDAEQAALLMGKLGHLIEHQHAIDFAASDKEELLVPVRSELAKAFVRKQRAHGITVTASCTRPLPVSTSIRSKDFKNSLV